MLLATTTVEDVDRFLAVFGAKGPEKRAIHGSKGATVFRARRRRTVSGPCSTGTKPAGPRSCPTARSRRSSRTPATCRSPRPRPTSRPSTRRRTGR